MKMNGWLNNVYNLNTFWLLNVKLFFSILFPFASSIVNSLQAEQAAAGLFHPPCVHDRTVTACSTSDDGRFMGLILGNVWRSKSLVLYWQVEAFTRNFSWLMHQVSNTSFSLGTGHLNVPCSYNCYLNIKLAALLKKRSNVYERLGCVGNFLLGSRPLLYHSPSYLSSNMPGVQGYEIHSKKKRRIKTFKIWINKMEKVCKRMWFTGKDVVIDYVLIDGCLTVLSCQVYFGCNTLW